MARKSIASRLLDHLRNFAAGRDGNIAMMFALMSVPVVGMMGAAIDYSRANAVKADLQSALDATALMVSKGAGSSSTNAQLQSAAESYFGAVYRNPGGFSYTVTAARDAAGASSVTLTGATSVPTELLGVIGIHNLNVSSTATVKWGTAKLRVALVLDNTLSMLQTDSTGTSKISALKTASHNLLNMLRDAATTAGDIQVAVVPFSSFIKVDPSLYRSKPWINWSYSSTSGGSGDGGSSSGCNGGDDDDGQPCHPSSSTWNGCFTDRDQSFDVQNTAPTTTNTHTYFPAVNCSITQILPLSYDWTALNNKIDAMTPAGATNQPIGLVWGWQALTSTDPLNAPATPADTQKVIILLTDGLNTQNRWTTNQSSIDAREQLVCSNIKTAGITVYTVLVMSGNSTVLQNCASSASQYFALTSAGQIVTTFNAIGTKLSQLRLAR
jgi:Flp pilus assembly protein TadG